VGSKALRRIAAALIVTCCAIVQANADYPERIIRMVVSAPAGTAPDIIARLIAPKMSERLGQPIVIDNKGGANGNLAALDVAKAAPDGYTVLMTVAGTLTANPSLYPKVTVPELDPVTQIATVDFIVAARPSLNVKSFPDLLELIRRSPGKINASTTAHEAFRIWRLRC
jgi:tripartite-type tricarboxylate transporter receptor subunit TctC